MKQPVADVSGQITAVQKHKIKWPLKQLTGLRSFSGSVLSANQSTSLLFEKFDFLVFSSSCFVKLSAPVLVDLSPSPQNSK